MIRHDIRQMRAYEAPACDVDAIKLDAMELPWAPEEAIRRKIAERIVAEPVHRYPDAAATELRAKIAALHGVAPEQVLLGNGSDEIIQMLMIAVDPGPVVLPTPSFVMYETIARWLRRPVAALPLGEDFSLDADRFLQLCAREKAELVFLACPNNPTGNLWPRETIERIAQNYMGLLVIDEAYAPYASRDHLDLVGPNVIVLRTLSKLGWAGLRLGYAIGDPRLIAELEKVRLPYNVSRYDQAAALVALEHWEQTLAFAERIKAERERLRQAIQRLDGFTAFASETNFLLVRTPDAPAIDAHLRKRKIHVKNLHGTHPLLAHCLRITVGTPEENDQLLRALEEVQ